mgnify:CR=1 FL=1
MCNSSLCTVEKFGEVFIGILLLVFSGLEGHLEFVDLACQLGFEGLLRFVFLP